MHVEAEKPYTALPLAERRKLRTEIVDWCWTMKFVERKRKGEIKRAVAEKYGYGYKRTERFLSLANKLQLAKMNRDREEFRSQSVEFYEKVAMDEKEAAIVRLKAQERIDKLLGLEAPSQVHQKVTAKVDSKLVIQFEGDDWAKLPRFDVATEGNGN